MITRDMSAEERLKYCQSVVQDQQDSGLNVTAFCADRKIPKARFYRYRAVVLGNTKEAEPEGGVYRVPDLSAQPEQDCIVLEANGIKMHVRKDADVDQVCRILRALQ